MDELQLIEQEKPIEKSVETPIDIQDVKSFDKIQNEFLQKQVEEGKTLTDITTDFAKAKVTSDLLGEDNKEFQKELAEERKDTLKESFKQDKVRQQKQTIAEKQQKAEAFYLSFRPILEFDFSNLVKVSKEDPNKPVEKTYKDRSYGIFLMVLMLCLLTIPYCIITIILAVFNGLNAVFEAVNNFGKIARAIVLSICFIVLALLAVYCILLGIEALFNIEIINKII